MAESMTERERQILTCLVEGLSNQEIAQRLHLAHKTVKWYNSQIYSKLGVANREEAIAQAATQGWLRLADTGETTPEARHNLPIQVTPFIGRRHELAQLARLIASPDTRVLTILAPGGMGKTRLALAAAEQQLRHFSDGVYFVPLAPLGSADAIVTAVAENIGLVFYGENPPEQQLVNFLKDREMLLVLDNIEHLLDGSELVSSIIQAARDVKIVVTSRERLNLRGETVYSLRGLDFPTWATPDDARESDAVKLFMQSANRARAEFELQADDLDSLARICRLTAGMPLGIELAAGWVDTLSLQQIAAEIQRGIDILETDMRDVPERHRSLRAAFEQTWRRLTSEEQTIFARLSVFRGGFTRESAEAVASATLRDLRKLAQKSLIQIETDERCAIHELLRQFGEDKLREMAELPVLQERHARYFADFMAERQPDSKSAKQLEAFRLIDAEIEDVRVAWQYFVNAEAWEQLPKFLHSFYSYASLGRFAQELADLLEPAIARLRSLAATTSHAIVLGQMLAVYGREVMIIGFPGRAVLICDEAVAILRQHGSPDALLVALYHQQEVLMFANRYDRALLTLEEGLRLAQGLDDTYWEAHFLRKYISAEIFYRQDYQQAILYAEQAQTLFDQLGMYYDLGLLYLLMGEAYVFQEQYEQAQTYFERSLPIARQFNKAPVASPAYFLLGRIAIVQGDLVLARHYLSAALLILWQTGYYWLLHQPLPYVALLYLKQQTFHRAVEVLACVDPNLIFWRNNDPLIRNLRDELASRLDEKSFVTAWKRGQERDLKALALELLAELTDE